MPGTMKGIAMSLEGVEDVKVRYDDRSLDVTFDDRKVSTEKIIKKIGDDLGLMLEEAEPESKKEGSVSETCPM